jgi:hypothetical protein
VDLVQPNLDANRESDQQLMLKMNEGYSEYQKENELRNSLKEFNPFQNELESLELFFRLESEKQAEMIERASSKSIFTQIARTISVIRGSAYKVESNPEITKMETISTTMLVDQRYDIDPDYYEWVYQNGVYGKNYRANESES